MTFWSRDGRVRHQEGAVFRQHLLAISSLMGAVSFSINNTKPAVEIAGFVFFGFGVSGYKMRTVFLV